MEKFRIENRDGNEFVINLEHNFTLKVIPPEKQEDYDYIPYQVVGVIFEGDFSRPELNPADFESEEDFAAADLIHLLGMDTESPEFEGVDITFWDDDVDSCNKELWLETVNYYCAFKLGKTAMALQCYGYQYELSERNCTPETLRSLNGGGPEINYHLN